jgi:hypothetical protein
LIDKEKKINKKRKNNESKEKLKEAEKKRRKRIIRNIIILLLELNMKMTCKLDKQTNDQLIITLLLVDRRFSINCIFDIHQYMIFCINE